ncbi:MAG: porin [Bacteroidales bacterium]|nr:porin [Bacteroidales bacterium]
MNLKCTKTLYSFFTKRVCLIIFSGLLVTAVKADEKGLLSDIKISERLFTDSTKIAKLENIVSKLPRMLIFINPRYIYADDGKPSGFDLRRAQIDLKGSVMKNLDYRLMLDFANNPKILDANASWTPLKELNIRAGQFKVPFSLETTYARWVLESPENSQIVEQLVYYSDDPSGIKSNGRDIGVSLYGGFFHKKGYNIIDYNVGVFNGNGSNIKDNNRKKDYIGTVMVNPIKPVTISFSFMNGRYGTLDAEKEKKRERYGVGLRYDDGKIQVRSEAVLSNTQVNIPDKDGKVTINTPVKNLKSYGWYALGSYYFIPKLQGVFKYDYMRKDSDNPLSEKTKYWAGLNYFFQKDKLSHVQLYYCYNDIPGQANINQIVAQLYIVF